MTAAQLAAMSDEQLLEHFKQYLDVTRPERVKRKREESIQPEVYLSPQKKAALAALAAEGIEIDMRRLKRRVR